MGADKEIIVALELGSTAIRAIAGKKKPDGSMQVLAISQEKTVNAIRKGVVDNIDKTTQAISSVIEQLSKKLNTNIVKVYVGLAGQSLRTQKNKVAISFPEKRLITNDMVDEMCDTNRGVVYPNAEILEVVPQEYLIANRQVVDPVGMQSESIEAQYANVIMRPNIRKDIETCINNAGLEIADILISPITLSDSLFSASDKRSGCAMADIGADTTTVAFYDGGALRHLIVIPLGGANVTKDIAGESIEIEEAEKLKLQHATAYSNGGEEINSKIAISHGREIGIQQLQKITEARYEEIIMNIWEQIKGKGKLLSGITFVGGGAKVKDLITAFSSHTKCDCPLRLAKETPDNISLDLSIQLSELENMQTLMALLLKGTQVCVSDTPKEQEPVQEEFVFETEQGTIQPTETPKESVVEAAPEVTSEPVSEKPKVSTMTKINNFFRKVMETLNDESED